MSQINVNTILPTVGSPCVSLNGVNAVYDNSLASMKLGTNNAAVLGNNNTIIGPSAATSVTGALNTIIGSQSGLFLTSGQRNTFVGANSGRSITTGFNNTVIGDQASYNSTTASENVVIGQGAGFNITTANNCVFIGKGAGQGVGNLTGFHNVAIGAGSTVSSASAYGEFVLGSLSTYVLRCNVTSITSLSDARDKKDVTDLRAGLDFINTLRPVEFVWDDRDENGKHDVADFGFIAQDLKAAQDDADMADILKLVYESNPEKLEASYGKLIPILVKAIQELSAEVKQLKANK